MPRRKVSDYVKLQCGRCSNSFEVKKAQEADYSFCSKCGGPLMKAYNGEVKLKCRCGKTTVAKAEDMGTVKFCQACGSPLFEDAPAQATPNVAPATPEVAQTPQATRTPTLLHQYPTNPGLPEEFWVNVPKPKFQDELVGFKRKLNYIMGIEEFKDIGRNIASVMDAVAKATADGQQTLERLIVHLDGELEAGPGTQAREGDNAQLPIPPEPVVRYLHGVPGEGANAGSIMVRRV